MQDLNIVTISTDQLKSILVNVLEPLKKELEETKADIKTLTEKFLTTKELAEKLNVKDRTIRDWSNAGKIPYYMLGDEKRFKMSEIDKVIKKIK